MNVNRKVLAILICVLLSASICASVSQQYGDEANKEVSNLRHALHKATGLFSKNQEKVKFNRKRKQNKAIESMQTERNSMEQLHESAKENQEETFDYAAHPSYKNLSLLLTVTTLFIMISVQIFGKRISPFEFHLRFVNFTFVF